MIFLTQNNFKRSRNIRPSPWILPYRSVSSLSIQAPHWTQGSQPTAISEHGIHWPLNVAGSRQSRMLSQLFYCTCPCLCRARVLTATPFNFPLIAFFSSSSFLTRTWRMTGERRCHVHPTASHSSIGLFESDTLTHHSLIKTASRSVVRCTCLSKFQFGDTALAGLTAATSAKLLPLSASSTDAPGC